MIETVKRTKEWLNEFKRRLTIKKYQIIGIEISHSNQKPKHYILKESGLVCLSETHVMEDFAKNEVDISGNNTHFVVLHRVYLHTGGTLIYIKHGYRYKEIINITKDKNQSTQPKILSIPCIPFTKC